MSALRISANLLLPSSVIACPACSSSRRINAAIQVPKLPKLRLTTPKLPSVRPFVDDVNYFNVIEKTKKIDDNHSKAALHQLYAILEAVADRIEMHDNIGEQRDNWNSLLLNSINMLTLTATMMAGFGSIGSVSCVLPLKMSSILLFSAATCMLLIMNKIQPSQLAEEQRKATRLFKELKARIETTLALETPSQGDVRDAMENVLALDKAYPLPLVGKMLEKFPKTFEPAVWWPSHANCMQEGRTAEKNGWSEELEMEMREIVKVLKMKDSEDYDRLGNKALKMHKILAISGPLLTGIAAVSSAFLDSSHGSLPSVVAVVAGALAATVNTFEHGGQIGMVFEMYRNSAGSFKLMEETIESTLEESEFEKRENGELFEMKVALKLGRSLSELRGLASKSHAARIEGVPVDEFGSKLL